ncbi:bifunctional helix-turn-helix transcriptional regulator/GNAT family N-acetyltransferase [Chelativorans sp. YIM 93263]|uniref:bifunctional helix-turn-helix transcriptional regulator/GNAT family N-acetyltransferase n=1 Tax=Chelativorans sp. YIM 93263 TaxID=2906648 RepID=UPI002378BCD0|nr:bifunctional helix-turn-helix transcriptional regulator/GNAT family N-acetyltransferase [Chelativorans sp. YIM 93263]
MQHQRSPSDEQIGVVREFTRFYTRQIGLLEEGLHKSKFPLTEARILFELARREGQTASELGEHLGLDPGYLSRILMKFEQEGLLRRERSADDGRRAILALTTKGHTAFKPLDEASRSEVTAMLAPLAQDQREKLISAMGTIQRLLGKDADHKVPYILRPLQVGDIGWITHRQAVLYSEEYGWGETFEALVAEILSTFVRNFDPRYEASWVAERHGAIVGSVFIAKETNETAKLRLLYVEPSARGLGIGRRLVDECLRFARAKGYRTITLWTNDVLVSARRIYQNAGFELQEEESHHSFGKDLVGQVWTLKL